MYDKECFPFPSRGLGDSLSPIVLQLASYVVTGVCVCVCVCVCEALHVREMSARVRI